MISWLIFFLVNWPWSSHFTKDNNGTSHTNEIYTQTPEDRSVTSPLRIWPNKHLPNMKSSWHDTSQNQLAKCPDKTQCSQTDSSMVDTRQINWRKCPNSTPCSQMVLDVRYTSEPIDKMPKWHSVLTNCLQCQIHVRTSQQNAQITLHVQKRSWPGSTPGDLLSLGGSQMSRCIFLFHQGKM